MSSVFDQAFTLSQGICDVIAESGINKMSALGSAEIHQYNIDPLRLLHSFGINHPKKAKLVIFDSPRASKRVPVNLFTSNEDGEIVSKYIAYNEPNYKYLLSANLLAYARLINRVLCDDGILVAVTTPEVYLIVRGAIEHFLGSDKFIGELVYQSRSGGGADSTWLSTDHETILIFSKNPQLISRFQLDKAESELKKYSLEDDQSAYYWDTYIRKNARNYYPIEAPDGTILEVDDDGNRISWLWRKQTFQEKLKVGDIKFEKLNGRWRLYYKDRLKDVKILRSLALNATLLKEIDDSLPADGKGGDLLNSKGSDQIKAFVGQKPDYLKPSDYYKFIYSVFNKSGGATLIPFPDYGAAAEAVSNHPSVKDTLIINNPIEFDNLIEWRLNTISFKKVVVKHTDESFDLSSFFVESNPNRENLVLQLISIKYSLSDEWHDFASDGLEMSFNISENIGFLSVFKISTEALKNIDSNIHELFDQGLLSSLHIFTEVDAELLRIAVESSEFSYDVFFHKIPDVFIK